MNGWFASLWSRPRVVFVVRLLATLLFLLFVLRIWSAWMVSRHFNLLLLLYGEVVTVMVYVMARPAVARGGPLTMAVTFLATFYFLFVSVQDGTALLPDDVTQPMQTVGIALQIVSKLYLGRSFGLLPANRGIVSRGPYRWVRHPIYLGYFINHLGFLLSTWSPYNAAIYLALYGFQVFRILEEEKLLRASPDYATYMKRVRYRVLPPLF
ncbi:MAG: isoprenylcysteine carboxylmethyltransferase family protein [Nevskiaceae bacterium]|nr:MAG: isoprenylcysteine carboxylmethyltransferase family protein [Nevskiaceae bacterium]